MKIYDVTLQLSHTLGGFHDENNIALVGALGVSRLNATRINNWLKSSDTEAWTIRTDSNGVAAFVALDMKESMIHEVSAKHIAQVHELAGRCFDALAPGATVPELPETK